MNNFTLRAGGQGGGFSSGHRWVFLVAVRAFVSIGSFSVMAVKGSIRLYQHPMRLGVLNYAIELIYRRISRISYDRLE